MTDKKYDIITSNAIHPRLNNNVYTQDYYEICSDRLSDKGVFCQWIPQNWMSEVEFKSLIKAFVEAFPHTTFWYVNEYSVMGVGKNKPLEVNFEQMQKKFRIEKLNNDLEDVGIIGPKWFVSQYWMSDEEARAWVEDYPSNTDNFPLVEFSKVISIEPNLQVMNELVDMKPGYSRFFNNPNEEEQAIINDLERYYDFFRKSMLGTIDRIHYFRQNNQDNVE